MPKRQEDSLPKEHDERDALNDRLERSFARWLDGTPFSAAMIERLGLRPVALERLQELYAHELVRLKKGEYASFEAVWGDLLREAGLDLQSSNPALEELERRHLARNFVYLERGTERAWKQVLNGDLECGVPALLKAARSGHGRALLYVSRLFRNGVGVEQDEDDANEALESAAETDCGAACLELGAALLEGRFGATDKVRGRKLLEKALRIGDTDTYAGLGRALASGLLGEERIAEGCDLLKRACGRGSAEAAYDLSALVGQGVTDGGGSTAFEYLQMAGQRGYGPAINDLASLFLNLARTGGEGCDLTPRECFAVAARWIERGARAGEPGCSKLAASPLTMTLSDGSLAQLSEYISAASESRPRAGTNQHAHGGSCSCGCHGHGHEDDEDEDDDEAGCSFGHAHR